jgi:hypothetical protein
MGILPGDGAGELTRGDGGLSGAADDCAFIARGNPAETSSEDFTKSRRERSLFIEN